MVPRDEILHRVMTYREDPTKITLKIMEESGEIAECLLKGWETQVKLGYELADVVICCQILAEMKGLDLAQAIQDKWHIVKSRKGQVVNGIFVKASDQG